MLDANSGGKKPTDRIKFEMNENITLVLENEFCKIYNDTKAGRTFKVINNEVVPIELRELNMWKARQRTPTNFVVKPVKDERGMPYDYIITRVNRGDAPEPISEPMMQQPMAQQPRQQQAQPMAQQPRQQQRPAQARPAAVSGSGRMVTTVISDAEKESRIRFEPNNDIEEMFSNEYFHVYRDRVRGRTFKVIGGEVANLDVRELNMWKNLQRHPDGFVVTVINDSAGNVYDYKIDRAGDREPPAERPVPQQAAVQQQSAPVRTAPPVQQNTPVREASVQPATPVAPAAPAAPARKTPAQQNARRQGQSGMVTEMTGAKPTNRVIFSDNETTEKVLSNEYCEFYKDKRASKVFKVVDGEIIPIELRELNMWKNRVKNPAGFAVTIMKDSTGKPFDYLIARINEDGSLTAAPVVTPPMPAVVPDTPPVPSVNKDMASTRTGTAPQSAPAASAVTQGTARVTDTKRVKFEETPTMKMLLENEYFKIYTDSRRGATFKVINGEIAPVSQRELNMWKNRQRRPKDFAVKVINGPTGAPFDYEITRTSNVTAAVETTTTKTNLPPVTERISVGGNKRRPNASRITNCALCGKEYKESQLFLFGNKNVCSDCMEVLVKEKLFASEHVDPIQKNIDDIVAADEIYCTYSLVTNYPYLNDDLCVNVCTIKRAAEIGAEDTIAQAIDEKGDFFDDLKRFGLKKIIVNNDSSHVYAPEDFDIHVKSEGLIAPKLYFKVLNYMQRGDDSLRTAIAESFLGSKVYTYALNSDITEITDENAEDFKPLTFTDGQNNFCPVFTDFTEARSVGMPFKGLYEIETRFLAYHKITHFIINPQSLGFIMNKTILMGVKPNYDRSLMDENDERLKNIDDFLNPFDIEDEVLARIEAEKVEEEEKKIQDIRDEADKAVAAEKALTEAAQKEIAQAKQDADTAKHQAEEAQRQAEEAKKQADESKRQADEAKRQADEAKLEMSAAKHDAELAKHDFEVANRRAEDALKKVSKAEAARDTEAARAMRAEKQVSERDSKIDELTDKLEKVKAEAAEARAKIGVSSAAAGTFAGKPQPKSPAASAFRDKDDERSSFDSLKFGGAASDVPSLELSGLLGDTNTPAAKEDAAPGSFMRQQAQKKDDFDMPQSGFKRNGVYGAQQPTRQQQGGSQGIVISSVSEGVDGGKVKKPLKVSMPLFVADVPDDELEVTPYSDGLTSPSPEKKTKGVNTVLSEMAKESEKNAGFDLASLMYGDEPAKPQQPQKAAPTIQEQAALIKAISRDLEVETNPLAAKDIKEKLDGCYRDLAKLIANAEVMYAEFDARTRHILIDGNNKGHIFSEKALAEKSVAGFAKAGIQVYLQEYKKDQIFNMLFEYRRHGIQELVLDETARWIIIPTDKISEALDVYERDYVKIPVMNPELMFSMTTLFQKMQAKSNNPNKEAEIRSLEKRMIREFVTAKYIMPMYGPDRSSLHPVSIDDKNGVKKYLVFSDEFEMKRFFGDRVSIVQDYEIVNYKEILKKYTVAASSVVVLNEGALRFEFNERNCDHITKVLEQ